MIPPFTKAEHAEMIDVRESAAAYADKVHGFENQIGPEYARCFAHLQALLRISGRLLFCTVTGEMDKVLNDDTAPNYPEPPPAPEC